MSGTIHPDQIKGLKIFDSASQLLRLCSPHEQELGEEIAGDVDDLVHSQFFQEKFGRLFPEDLTDTHFNIRLKDHTLIVQLMRENAASASAPEGLPVAIDLAEPADGEVIEINRTILDKADALFRKCQNGHTCSHRSSAASPLRERAVDLTRLSDLDLSDELASREHNGSRDRLDEISPPLRRRRLNPPSRSEQSARTVQENLSDTLRSARQIQFNLQKEADQLLRQPDATLEQLAPLHEQIRRLEQQIQRLSEQLGIPQRPSQTTSTDTSPLVQRIFDRLSGIEERLRQLESYEATQPSASNRALTREDGSTRQRSYSDTGAQT
ncbi:MAG: hypothetical protein JSR93_06480, partial [Verrucomicrobia bacterium]|nr:hypothetical protein [Verrucomicrobiota bacterium]